jgi:hypothetical protein
MRLPSPDLNLVGWVVHHPRLQQLEQVNALNEGIYSRLGGAGMEPPYWITRTRLKAPGSRGVALPLVAALGLPAAAWEHHGLVVLRVTVMDPFFAESPPSAPDHCGGLVRAVATAAKEAVASLLA